MLLGGEATIICDSADIATTAMMGITTAAITARGRGSPRASTPSTAGRVMMIHDDNDDYYDDDDNYC